MNKYQKITSASWNMGRVSSTLHLIRKPEDRLAFLENLVYALDSKCENLDDIEDPDNKYVQRAVQIATEFLDSALEKFEESSAPGLVGRYKRLFQDVENDKTLTRTQIEDKFNKYESDLRQKNKAGVKDALKLLSDFRSRIFGADVADAYAKSTQTVRQETFLPALDKTPAQSDVEKAMERDAQAIQELLKDPKNNAQAIEKAENDFHTKYGKTYSQYRSMTTGRK